MSLWSISLVCTGLTAISFVLFLGSTTNVYATDFTIDVTSCTLLPGGGTTWNAITSTCSKTSGGNMVFLATDTLTIQNGVTLEFTTNRDLVNRGMIINNGIINSTSGGDISNRDSGIFTNSGTIELNSTLAGSARFENRDTAFFTNTISGLISLDGLSGQEAQIRNRHTASFTNFGTITIEGIDNNSGQLQNLNDASFTNSGTITIVGVNNNSGRLWTQQTSDFTNSGTITINGVNNNSGQLRNQNDATITNSKIITINGVNNNSGQLQNNNNGLIINICGIITFVSMTGNPIQEDPCTPLLASGSDAYEDPTIGKSHNGIQVVENGICIDIQCWTVTADYHQDFELVEMLSHSTHTISTTVFCQNGVVRCNYVAFGVSPYGTNINDSVWKIILQKDHRDNWTLKVVDPDVYLGEVTSTTQIVNDGKHLSASATIEFKKPTPGMILNVEVRDSKGGYRDFKFNDGIAIADAYAYPQIETSYDPPLDIKPLCLNENPNKRYTCAFAKIKEWTIKNAEATLEQMNK